MVSLAVGEAAATENIFEYRHCLGIEDASAVVRVCHHIRATYKD